MSKSKFVRSRGKISEPYLIMTFGVNGVGKSSFAAEAPRVVFLDVEGGSKRVDVERMPTPETFTQALEMLTELFQDKDVGSIAIDTADHLEILMIKDICSANKIETLSDLGFGKGYDLLKKSWAKLFDLFEEYRMTKNIILLGHAEIKDYGDPSLPQSYKRHQIKLSRQGTSIIKDKVDAILFMNYETIISVDKNTKQAKAYGGEQRVLFTEYRASHDGKNRYGLPYKINLEKGSMWKSFDDAVKSSEGESIEVLFSQISGFLEKPIVDEVKKKALEAFEAVKTSRDNNKASALRDRLREITKE